MIKKDLAISETGFLFNPLTGSSYSLNTVAMDIVNLLKENKSKDEIQYLIMERYEVDETTFENDYYDFLKLLQQYKLLQNAA